MFAAFSLVKIGLLGKSAFHAPRKSSVLSPWPNQALKMLGKFVKDFRAMPGVEGHLLGVGIAFSGLYDVIRDQIDHPHLLLAEGWRGLRVKEAFRNLSNPSSAFASYGATGSAFSRGRSTRPVVRPSRTKADKTPRLVFLIQTDSHAAAVGESAGCIGRLAPQTEKGVLYEALRPVFGLKE